MVSPSDKQVDMPIDGGFVGMVDRDEFDEWLRERLVQCLVERRLVRRIEERPPAERGPFLKQLSRLRLVDGEADDVDAHVEPERP